jgi:hypothetical protein
VNTETAPNVTMRRPTPAATTFVAVEFAVGELLDAGGAAPSVINVKGNNWVSLHI